MLTYLTADSLYPLKNNSSLMVDFLAFLKTFAVVDVCVFKIGIFGKYLYVIGILLNDSWLGKEEDIDPKIVYWEFFLFVN